MSELQKPKPSQGMTTQPGETYEIGESVLVFYGPLLFDATVLDIDLEDPDPYLVHFHGWNKRHDLWVPLTHMVKVAPDTRIQQQELSAKFSREKEKSAKRRKVQIEQQKNNTKSKADKNNTKSKADKNNKKKSTEKHNQQQEHEVPLIIAEILENIFENTALNIHVTADLVKMYAQECCHNFSTKKNGKLSKSDLANILLILGKSGNKKLNMAWLALTGVIDPDKNKRRKITSNSFVKVFQQQRDMGMMKKQDLISQNENETSTGQISQKRNRRQQQNESKNQRDKKSEISPIQIKKNKKDVKTNTKEVNDPEDETAFEKNKENLDASNQKDIIAWFENHDNKSIRDISSEVETLHIDAILEVEKVDWQATSNSSLAASAIMTFLKQFRPI